MFGPKPKGFWTDDLAANSSANHQFLKRGKRYRVIQEFVDYDGDRHPVGEVWTFLGSSYVPYEAGLSLFVSPEGKDEWQIRMQWYQQAQGPILDDLAKYIRASTTKRGR